MTIEELKDKSIEELEKLFSAYPYASIISTVLAKKANEENHSSYQDYLSKASLRSPNRSMLKQYINETQVIENIPEVEPINQGLNHHEAKQLASTLHPVNTAPIAQATELDLGEIVLDNPTTPKKVSHEENEELEVIVNGKQEFVEVEIPEKKLEADWEKGMEKLSHHEAKQLVKELRTPDTSPLAASTEVDEGEIVLDNPLTVRPTATEDLDEQEVIVVGKDELVEVENPTKQNDDEPVSFTGFSGGSAYISQREDVEDFRFVQPEIESEKAVEPAVEMDQPTIPDEENASKDIEIEIYELDSRTVESISDDSENPSIYKKIVNLLKEEEDHSSQTIAPKILDAEEDEMPTTKVENDVDDELEALYAQASYELKMEKELTEMQQPEQDKPIIETSIPRSSDFEMEEEVELPIEPTQEGPKEELSIEIESIPETIGDASKTNSFTGWLGQLSNMGTSFSEDQKVLQQSREEYPQKDVEQGLPVDDRPTISESEVKRMAKKSLESSTSFYTETFGYVYELQEKWAKAIEVYEYLSLQNPQKSGYFASRIELLKEKLK